MLVFGDEKKWVKGPRHKVKKTVDGEEKEVDGDYIGDEFVIQLEDTSRWQWVDLPQIRDVVSYFQEPNPPFDPEGIPRADPKWSYLTKEELAIRDAALNEEFDPVALARRKDDRPKTPEELRKHLRKSTKQVKAENKEVDSWVKGGKFQGTQKTAATKGGKKDVKKEKQDTSGPFKSQGSDMLYEKLRELMQEKVDLEGELKKANEDADKYKALPAAIKSLEAGELLELRECKNKLTMLKTAVEMHFSTSLHHMNMNKDKKDKMTLEALCPPSLLALIRDPE